MTQIESETDILSQTDQSGEEPDELVDLLADRIAATTSSDTGSAAGTYEVSMAGGEDGFQDGEPKDPPGSDGEGKDIVKALKEQGFIKDSPGSDGLIPADPDAPENGDFNEIDPEGGLSAQSVQALSEFAHEAQPANGGFDSGIELWI